MFQGEIRGLCIKIMVRFKDNDKVRNVELRKLLIMISKGDLFKGEKLKLNKLIKSFLKKPRKVKL